jgi:hypothetical protein
MEGKTGDDLLESFCRGDLKLSTDPISKSFATYFKRHEAADTDPYTEFKKIFNDEDLLDRSAMLCDTCHTLGIGLGLGFIECDSCDKVRARPPPVILGVPSRMSGSPDEIGSIARILAL